MNSIIKYMSDSSGKARLILIMIFSLSVLFISCEDDITLDFPEYNSKIVVEGSIEQGEVARVYLTRSTGYFEEINVSNMIEVEFMGSIISVPEFLYNTLVLDAFITVSDGLIIDTLKMSYDPYIFPYIYYVGNSIVGEIGETYSLYIESETNILEGITTIPQPVQMDSLWFEFRNDEEDTLGFINGYFDDPADDVNFYRIFSKTDGRDSTWVHPGGSVWHDRNINGEEDNLIVIYHGENRTDDPESMERWYFRIGEHVTIKLCSIDKQHYDFWDSFQQNAGGGGNPFSEPVPLNSNVTGGYGIWGGYASSLLEFDVEYIEPEEE